MGIRDIIFRGKRADNGEWVVSRSLRQWKNGIIRLVNDEAFIETFITVIPESVGQYTDLKVNGQKVFEGDIIKISGRSSFYAEVTYSKDSTSYWVENKNLEYFAELGSINPSFIEVVGNVTDNPELLEVE